MANVLKFREAQKAEKTKVLSLSVLNDTVELKSPYKHLKRKSPEKENIRNLATPTLSKGLGNIHKGLGK